MTVRIKLSNLRISDYFLEIVLLIINIGFDFFDNFSKD